MSFNLSIVSSCFYIEKFLILILYFRFIFVMLRYGRTALQNNFIAELETTYKNNILFINFLMNSTALQGYICVTENPPKLRGPYKVTCYVTQNKIRRVKEEGNP